MTAGGGAGPTYLTYVATEAVRSANHAAYDAPRDPVALYDRAGALHDLLGKTQQLAQVLSEAVEHLSREPHLATGPGDPARSSLHLADAAVQLEAARTAVSRAWPLLAGLRLDES